MHGLRTESNHTPLQLFHAGALRLQNSGLQAMDLFELVGDDYGIDYDDDSQVVADDSEVGCY